MRHATGIQDFGTAGVEEILAQALAWKQGPHPKHLVDKILGMVFFNPSLRTRASFEAVMARAAAPASCWRWATGSGSWRTARARS
jgi:N-acetylornithine carbamoyltransferase